MTWDAGEAGSSFRLQEVKEKGEAWQGISKHPGPLICHVLHNWGYTMHTLNATATNTMEKCLRDKMTKFLDA
jgi:hypothetical protein